MSNRWKQLIILIVVQTFVFNILSYAYDSNIILKIGNTEIEEVLIKNGTAFIPGGIYFEEENKNYIPVREFFQDLGYTVDWSDDTKTIRIYYGFWDKYFFWGTPAQIVLWLISLLISIFITAKVAVYSDRKIDKRFNNITKENSELKGLIRQHSKVVEYNIVLFGLTNSGKTTLIQSLFGYNPKELKREATKAEYKTEYLPICFQLPRITKSKEAGSIVHSFVFHDTAGEKISTVESTIQSIVNNNNQFCVILMWDLEKQKDKLNNSLISEKVLRYLFAESVKSNRILRFIVFLNKVDIYKNYNDPNNQALNDYLNNISNLIRNQFKKALPNQISGPNHTLEIIWGATNENYNVNLCKKLLVDAFDLWRFIPTIDGNL